MTITEMLHTIKSGIIIPWRVIALGIPYLSDIPGKTPGQREP
jgi:hypothetical protein